MFMKIFALGLCAYFGFLGYKLVILLICLP